MGQSKEMFMEQREFEMNEMLSHQFPVSKQQIAIQAQESVDHILENGDPLKVAESLSAIDEFISAIRKNPKLISYVRDELAKSRGKVDLASGTKLEAIEAGVEYDFSKCGDPIYELYQQGLEKFKSLVKIRQEFLRKLPAEGMEFLHEDELVKVFPPTKKSTSTFKVSLAK